MLARYMNRLTMYGLIFLFVLLNISLIYLNYFKRLFFSSPDLKVNYSALRLHH